MAPMVLSHREPCRMEAVSKAPYPPPGQNRMVTPVERVPWGGGTSGYDWVSAEYGKKAWGLGWIGEGKGNFEVGGGQGKVSVIDWATFDRPRKWRRGVLG